MSDPTMHPLAHHTTNIMISEDDHGTVLVVSKALVVGRNGRMGSGVYRDVVVKTPAGWRLKYRRAEARGRS